MTKNTLYASVSLLFFLFISTLGFASGTKIISINTGINDMSGTLIPWPQNDDSWQVLVPGATCYQPVQVTGCMPSFGLGCRNNIRWISPYINSTGYLTNAPDGYYYYKYTFTYSTADCPPLSAKLQLDWASAAPVIDGFILNGHSYPMSITVNPLFTPAIINMPGSFIVDGTNEIIFRVNNTNNSITGMQLEGSLTIENSATHNLFSNLTAGVAQLCIDNPVFSNIPATQLYYLEVGQQSGSTYTWLSTQASNGWAHGQGSLVSAREVFENDAETPVQFGVGPVYRFKAGVQTGCGYVENHKDVNFVCCENAQPDASFTLTVSGGKLIASGKGWGSHVWHIYAVSGGVVSPEPVHSSTDRITDLDIEGACYYVEHSVSNGCKDACESRRICDLPCGSITGCNLTTPYNLQYTNRGSDRFTWAAVSSAGSYIVEITIADPDCCGPDPMQWPSTHVFSTTTNVLTIDWKDALGLDYPPQCFSWKVKARCEDDTESNWSSKSCVTVETSEAVKQPVNTGIGNAAGTSIAAEVYPNPAKGNASINIETSEDVAFSIVITDISGKVVKTFDNLETINKRSSVNWETGNVSKGVYLVKIVTSDSRVADRKIIVE